MRVALWFLPIALLGCSKSGPVTSPAPVETPSSSQDSKPKPAAPPPSAPIQPVANDAPRHRKGNVSYRCESGSRIDVGYDGEAEIQLHWNGRPYRLRSSSASSFTNGTLTWRLDGDRGSLEERGQVVASGCAPV